MRLNGVNKNDLLDAGMSIVEENGLDKLSIHSAKDKVNASAQPFYSYFVNIDVYRATVLDYIADLYLNEASKVINKEAPAASYALYIHEYAQKHTNLYNALVQDGFFKKEKYLDWLEKYVSQYSACSDKVLDFLMWVYGKIMMEGPKEPAQMIQKIREIEGFPEVLDHFCYRGREI